MKSHVRLLRTLASGLGALILSALHPAQAAPPVDKGPAGSSCIEAGHWAHPGDAAARRLGPRELLPTLAEHEVVLLGEQHDRADDHRWQLQTLAALHALRPDLVIGFEAFPRSTQPVLERWVAGELGYEQFLAQVDWERSWGWPAELYRPLFEFARINRIPMRALNVDRKLVSAVSTQGWEAVPESAREGVSRPAPPSPAYVDFLHDMHREHQPAQRAAAENGAAALQTDPAFRNFVDAQMTWDRAMAEALARPLTAPAAGKRALVVGIIGNGHLRHGHGVPHQLRALGLSRIATLLPVSADTDCAELRPGLADAVFALPVQTVPPAPPPRLGVRLSADAQGARIIELTAGSLAEKSGLKRGDVVLESAGKPVTQLGDLIAAVHRQPPGTWLPLRVQRGSRQLELTIRFPVQP
jgi:uncharacterized iron-regulated protein